MQTSRMAHMTWRDYAERVATDVLILPIGSIEQHAPHLPLGLDAMTGEAFALELAKVLPATVAPTISYGYKSLQSSSGGPLFPGTIDLNGVTMINLVKDVLQEFLDDGWRRILIMNAHYENLAFELEACDLLLRRQQTEFPKILVTSWWNNVPEELMPVIFDQTDFPGWDLEHAAIAETSMFMYLYPELVREDRMRDEGVEAAPRYEVFPAAKGFIPESGCLHTARSASAEKGRLLIEGCVKVMAADLRKEFKL